MEQNTIKFRAINQELTRSEQPRFASDTVNYIRAEFDLQGEWENFDSVTAIWANDSTSISTALDSDNACNVPSEVLTRRSVVEVNLVGFTTDNEELVNRLTTYPVAALVVDDKARLYGYNSEITPTLFEQFVGQVEDFWSDMPVQATTLPAGSDATASFDITRTLNLGIPKGDTGEAAGFGTVTATVDDNHGTPAVTVTASGDDTAKNFAFAFSNLQPAPYDDSELQNDFAVLQGQFDTAVAAVTTDTEVTDIRVGADGVTDTTAGASVRRQFTALNNWLKSDGVGYEPDRKNTYHDTHFFKIDYVQSTKALPYYKSDSTTALIAGGNSIIYKCPKYLGWFIEHPSNLDIGSNRLYLYILKLENGSLVLDPDFIFATTGGGVYNYLNARQNKFVKVPDNRYFYFAGRVGAAADNDVYTIIGCDEWVENDLMRGAYTDWACNANGSLAESTGCSMFIPEGSFYALHPDDYASGVEFRINYVDTESETSKGKQTFFPSFGYVDKGEGFALLRRADNLNLNSFKVYISSSEIITPNTFPSAEVSEKLADKYTSEFEWVAKNNTANIAHASRTFKIDKKYYGVPYSSRWHDAHSIYFEITPETFYNAVNDPYSIFYDNDVDRSVLPSSGGPGYGLVCSSFASLCMGSDYPQSNCGFFWDENFETSRSNNFNAGDAYNNPQAHCTYVNALLKNGYVLYEGISACCSKTIRTGTGNYVFQGSKTKINYLEDYGYRIHIQERAGFKENAHIYNDFDFTVANGLIRPWRGNKCVYGSWDVSEDGKGIWVTIHDDEISTFSLKKPSDEVVSVSIPSGDTVVDITSYVDEDGIYELYSGTYESAVIEYFKFIDHEPITYSFSEDGSVVFSSNDAEYCYAFVDSMPDKYIPITPLEVNAVVLANTSKHPFAKYPNIESHLLFTSACMVYDEWGKYAVPCSYVSN